MDKESSRNTIIFIVCALAMLLIYDRLVMAPQRKARAAQEVATATSSTAPATPAAPVVVPLAEALAESPRAPIETPALTGSIALKGARLDHLFLKGYRESLDPGAPLVEMLRPGRVEHGYYATTGWAGQNVPGLPDANTVWTLIEGDTLAPGKPLVLGYDTEALGFRRKVEVDDKYLFTVTDWAINRGTAPITLAPYAMVQHNGLPPVSRRNSAVEGHVSNLGMDGKYRLKQRRFRNWIKDGSSTIHSRGGWAAVTEKYWLTALIPQQGDVVDARLGVSEQGGTPLFDVSYTGQGVSIAPGATASETHHIFAGAKRYEILTAYEKSLGAPRLGDAIDWGVRLWPITKPIFLLIEWFQSLSFVGNFGIAILMMTVVVKIVFFFPANMSFESMTKMKKVQPQMEALKERYKEDPAQLQQAMMKLYKDEKINPLLGCLPMLATIPVFLGLFHVLNTTIEMRHAPFFGWIHDLSAPDPTTIWNLFGLMPWDPSSLPFIGAIFAGALHLGVWPLLYGGTMALTQSMSPPAADPTQQMIMRWMPIVFTFVLANFAVGLLIYYTWSNLLTIVQQYVIMRRFKVDNPIDGLIRRVTGKPKPAG